MNSDVSPPTQSDPELAAYLHDRDVVCPSCGTLLRGMAAPACPSCGVGLSVPTLQAAPGQGASPPLVVVRILAAIAACVAAYLAFTGLTDRQPAGCSPGAGCGEVLSSRWSSLWGVPVSLPGLFVYLAIFLCTFQVSPAKPDARRREAWTALIALAVFAGLGALWFIYLQAFVIKSFCPYCMIDHACGVLIAALVLYDAPIKRGESLSKDVRSSLTIGSGRAGALVATAATIMLLFTLAQHAFPAKTYDVTITADNGAHVSSDGKTIIIDDVPKTDGKAVSPPATTDKGTKDAGVPKDGAPPLPAASPYVRLRMPKGPAAGVQFARTAFPVRGDVNAPYLFICLVDYTCPHCRAFHHLLPKIFARYGNQVAFMMLPMPLNKDCNRYVQFTDERHIPACDLGRLSLAVWKTNPSKFAEYDDWLFAPEAPRTAAEARAKAEELVGKDALKAMFDTGWPHEQLLKTVQVYDYAGQGYVPKVMFSNVRIEGPIAEKQFYDLLENETELKLKPIAK